MRERRSIDDAGPEGNKERRWKLEATGRKASEAEGMATVLERFWHTRESIKVWGC